MRTTQRVMHYAFVRRRIRPAALTTLVAVATVASSAVGQSLFQVGNSLTEDSAPNGIAAMGSEIGLEITSGLHLQSNSTLNTIWNDPTDYTRIRNQWGTFDEALPNHEWDHVVLQVFSGAGEQTLADDVEVFERYRSLAEQNPDNADSTYYVYGPWPWTTRWSGWEQPVADEDLTPTTHRREYFDHLVDRLNHDEPDRWRLIPGGEVFFELRDRIANDQEGPFSELRSIYRDPIHANGVGRLAAATTVFATVFQTNPVGLPIDYAANPLWNPTVLPPDLTLAVQEVVWDVVVRTKRSGVSPLGDFDISTVIDEQDYGLWSAAFAAESNLSADANGDGVVDQADGEMWLAAAQPGTADINDDRTIDEEDRAAWQSSYATSGVASVADVNGDGLVNAVDYTIWRDEFEVRQAADFNSDGVVNAADAAVWQAELGWSVDLPTDANGDGVVNAADYTIWRDNRAVYNTPLSVSIPEPSAVLVALVSSLCLLVHRRVV